MEKTISQELDENVQQLNEIVDRFDDLVELAIERILKTIKVLRKENLELALELSRVYENEPFWEK